MLEPPPPLAQRCHRTDPKFDGFDSDSDLCNGPAWEYDAGITLLSIYMLTMAILMLNLLIAVLGTVHDNVSQRAEIEFNLARNQFIQRGASVVNDGHLPPPLNLVMAVTLIVVDIVGEVRYQLGRCPKSLPSPDHERSAAAAPAASGGGGGEVTAASIASGGRDSRPTQEKPLQQSKRARERVVMVSRPRTAEIAPGSEPTAYGGEDDEGMLSGGA